MLALVSGVTGGCTTIADVPRDLNARRAGEGRVRLSAASVHGRPQSPEGHTMGERRMRWVITARQSCHVLSSIGLMAVRPAWSVGRIGARWWA